MQLQLSFSSSQSNNTTTSLNLPLTVLIKWKWSGNKCSYRSCTAIHLQTETNHSFIYTLLLHNRTIEGVKYMYSIQQQKKEGKPHSIRTKANANSTTLTIFFKCSLSAFLCLLSSSQTCHSNTPIGSSIGHRMRRGFIGKDPGGIGWIFRYRLTAFHKINQIRNTRRVFDGFAFPLSAIICSLILSVNTHTHTHTVLKTIDLNRTRTQCQAPLLVQSLIGYSNYRVLTN